MKGWIEIPNADLIPIKEGRKVSLNGEEIALFRLENRYLAVENKCPHQQGPLSDGIVSGNSVFCPLHSLKICLKTGLAKKPGDPNCHIKTYLLKKENKSLFIQVEPARTVLK